MMGGMGRAEFWELGRHRLILSLPAVDAEDLIAACEVLWQEGHRVWSVPLERLDDLAALLPVFGRRAKIGVSGVDTAADAHTAIAAGAAWLSSLFPLAELPQAAGPVPVVLGGLTPAELRQAYAAGVSAVQVVPADAFGSSYARSLPSLLPEIPLLATGRLEHYQAGLWLSGGAEGVWHTDLIEPDLVVDAGLGPLRALVQRWARDD